jgi:glycosyltransferase 2 family protein
MIPKILRITVSIGILTFLAFRTDWQQLGQAFSRLQSRSWLGALGIYLLAQVLSSWRWRMLAKPLGFRGSRVRFAGIYFIGMFFNLFFPTSVGGDVIRAWYLNNGQGWFPRAMVSVLADRTCGLVVLLLIAFVGVMGCPFSLPSNVTWSVFGLSGGILLGMVLVPALVPLFHSNAKIQWIAKLIQDYREHPGLLIKAISLAIAVQAGNVLLVWLLGVGLQLPIPAIYYWIFVPMVTLFSLIPISLNGMGVREAATVIFLAPMGINPETAICLGLLWFSVFTAASLFGGILYFAGLYPRPKVEANHGCVDSDPHQGRTGQSQAAA